METRRLRDSGNGKVHRQWHQRWTFRPFLPCVLAGIWDRLLRKISSAVFAQKDVSRWHVPFISARHCACLAMSAERAVSELLPEPEKGFLSHLLMFALTDRRPVDLLQRTALE